MEQFYSMLFAITAVVAFGLEFSKPQQQGVSANQAFFRFRNNYLLVWSLMMGGDWLQGPYVYALYSYYGFGQRDIGRLFIAGFGASLLVGTVVGSLADRYGRKLMCLVYVVSYALSCATKHSSDYNVLLVGRFLGGIATSLLFSVFESWVVSEHFKRGYDGEWLSDLFSKAVFLGNGLMAILAGLLANFFVENLSMGPVAPFDLSAAVLLAGGAVVMATWPENKGEPIKDGAKSDIWSSTVRQFSDAYRAIRTDEKVALLGAMQSLYEASMYTFVFLWTPALSPHGEKIPHGMIFSCFMVACMAGAAISARLAGRHARPEDYMPYVFGAAALSLLVPVLVSDAGYPPVGEVGGITGPGKVQMVAFLGFEVTVGIFWPSMMKMRSQYVPEGVRATVMNLFRVPLNLFVCVVLFNVDAFPMSAMFCLTAAFLGVCVALQYRLTALAGPPGAHPRPEGGAVGGH